MLTRSFSTELAADFQAILNFMPGAYLVLSPQLQVELVSAGYQAAVSAGWPNLAVGEYVPAVLEGAPVRQCLARKLMASLTQVLLAGQPHEVACRRTCQLPNQSLAGTPVAWQLVSQPVRDAAGIVRHLLCQVSLEPPTPALARPKELAVFAPISEPILGAVLAQLPIAPCLLRGPRHVVEVFNPLAARVWSLPVAEVLGRPFLELLPKTAVVDYAAVCAEVWQSSQSVVWAALPIAGFSGAEYPADPTYFSLSFQAFQPQRGEEGGLLLVAQNVTPLLQAHQQAQQLQAELTATTAGLADYVAELLHAAANGEKSSSPNLQVG